MNKRQIAHSEEERQEFISQGFKEVGKEENGNFVFWSNKIEDILSKREMEVYNLRNESNIVISEKLNVSEKSVMAYRKKITAKGF